MIILHFSEIECPICHKKEWIFHGSYERNLIIQNHKYSFYITRVICKHCDKTHAIIPDFLIPFMSRLAGEIIDAYSMEYVGHPHRPDLYSVFYTFFLLLNLRNIGCLIEDTHDIVLAEHDNDYEIPERRNYFCVRASS